MAMKTVSRELRNAAVAAAAVGMLIMPARNSLAQDTVRVNAGDGKVLVLKAKPHMGVKAFGELYNGGKGEGIGLGATAGLDINKASAGGSLSFVKEGGGKGVKLYESSVWASAPIGKVDITGYAYTDLFIGVPEPAIGASASGYGVKAGAEVAPYKNADGYWAVYANVPCGSFTPGVALAGWGNSGWKGGAKKVLLSLGTQHKITKELKLGTELSYGKVFSCPDGVLRFRATMTYSPF